MEAHEGASGTAVVLSKASALVEGAGNFSALAEGAAVVIVAWKEDAVAIAVEPTWKISTIPLAAMAAHEADGWGLAEPEFTSFLWTGLCQTARCCVAGAAGGEGKSMFLKPLHSKSLDSKAKLLKTAVN